MKFCEAIRFVRTNKLFMSQTQFANLLGVGYSSVNRWENKKYKPSFEARKKLAPIFEKYGVEVED